MRERPILFSSPMVRAILAGQKTVTRRLVKPAALKVNVPDFVPVHIPFEVKGKRSDLSIKPGIYRASMNDHGAVSVPVHGERVGVKPAEFQWASPYGAPGDTLWVRETWAMAPLGKVALYRANGDCDGVTWRPSIHMPRAASRLTLRVVSVRVERLCSLDDSDAIREGIPAAGDVRPFARFADLWDAINGKRAPWASDPWVWRVEFTREVADVR